MERFTILMYHMICEPETPQEARYACPPERFRQHMQSIRDKGFTPVSLAQAGRAINTGETLPEKAIVITLDDGFEDNYRHAFPIMSEFDIPATIFLATDYLAGENSWMQGDGFPNRAMLNWTQIKEMAKHGIDFGAHTASHPRLATLTKAEVVAELSESKLKIEDQLSTPCEHFAYPYGNFGEKTPGLVKAAGFTLACSTRSGFNNETRDPFVLHRLEVYGTDPVWKLMQKTTFGHNDASLLFPLKYYATQLKARF